VFSFFLAEFDAVVDSGLLHCLSDDEIKAYAVNLRSLVTVGGKVYIVASAMKILTLGITLSGFQK